MEKKEKKGTDARREERWAEWKEEGNKEEK